MCRWCPRQEGRNETRQAYNLRKRTEREKRRQRRLALARAATPGAPSGNRQPIANDSVEARGAPPRTRTEALAAPPRTPSGNQHPIADGIAEVPAAPPRAPSVNRQPLAQESADSEEETHSFLRLMDRSVVRASLPHLHEKRAQIDSAAARVEARVRSTGLSIADVCCWRGCVYILTGAWLQATAVAAVNGQPPRGQDGVIPHALLRLATKMCRNDSEHRLWNGLLTELGKEFGFALDNSVHIAECRVLKTLRFTGPRGLVKLLPL